MAVVQIDGKGYDARREDTATRIVIPRDEIVRYGEVSLADVLKRMPGISIDGVQGRRGSVRMRGLGGGYTQILLDGVAMPAGFSLDTIAPDLVERIEILRSATADLSTQGIAGTINIVLRKIVASVQQELKLVQTRQHARDSTNLSGRSNDKLGKLSYSLGASVAQGFTDYPSARSETAWQPDGTGLLARDTAQSEIGRSRNLQLTPRATLQLANNDLLSLPTVLNLRQVLGRDHAISSASMASDAATSISPI